jgi:hypothetical protein
LCRLKITGVSQAYIHCFWTLKRACFYPIFLYVVCYWFWEIYLVEEYVFKQGALLRANSDLRSHLICHTVTSLHTGNIIYMYYMQNPTCYSFLGSWQWSTRGQQVVHCAIFAAGLPHWHGRWRSIFEMLKNVNYFKVKSRLNI